MLLNFEMLQISLLFMKRLKIKFLLSSRSYFYWYCSVLLILSAWRFRR